ncbi:MAG: CARDB domain-containing protein [Solirubrobacterales bacterium]
MGIGRALSGWRGQKKTVGLVALLTIGWGLLFSALVPPSTEAAWLPTTSLTQAGQDADWPEVAFGPDGTTTVAWVRSNGTNDIAQASTRPAGSDSFTVPVDLSLPGQSASFPQVIAGSDGTTTVVWYRTSGPDSFIQAATRSQGEGSFSAPTNLSLPGGFAYNPVLAVGPNGTTTIGWSRQAGGSDTIQTATRQAGSTTFTTPLDVFGSATTTVLADLLVAPDGTITALLYQFVGSDYRIRAATRAPGSATFSAPVDISVPGGSAEYPRGSVGPDGSITVVWQQGSGGLDEIKTAFRAAGSSTFSAPTTLSQGGVYNRAPQIAAGPDGATTAVWYSYDGTRTMIQAASKAAGAASFGAPSTISTGTTNAFNPAVTIGSDGTTTAAWYQFDGMGGSLIQAATRAAGAPSFGQPVALTAPGGEGYNPKLASGPCGSYTTAVWERTDGADYIIQQASEPTAVCRPSLANLKAKGPKKAKLNKKVVFRITATNSGDATATGLKLKAAGKGVKASKSVGSLAAGKSKTVKLPLKFKKQGKVKVTFTLTSGNAGKKTVKKTVKVG